MKCLFLVHKATRRFIASQQYHFHGCSDFGSRYRTLYASNSIGWSKPRKVPSNSHQMHVPSLNYCYRYSTESSQSLLNEKSMKKVDLEIISREIIKPVFPTPRHLRNFNLSIIDQVIFDYYTPVILFVSNNNEASFTDVVSKRSKHLKEALSQILTLFYPLAGDVKDNLHIECNDKGVYYMEARVHKTLEEYLSNPDDEKLRELMPERPQVRESSVGNYVIGIQVNIFNCGGIGLSMTGTHKIMDFHTYMMFMKAWATAVRGSPETVSPSFVASEIFPNDPSLEYTLPSELTTSELLCTKRFVFDPSALSLLKTQHAFPSRGPTRMEATTALIWKAVAKAASTVRRFSRLSPHAFLTTVNLRKKASPPFPDNSIGNIITLTSAICFPKSQPDLPTLMGKLRESIATINSDYIESVKGEKGHKTVKEILKGLNYLTNATELGDCVITSSLLNGGIYDLDFGWGKPIWFYLISPGNASFVVLNDTLKRGGVEAIVTLSRDEMKIFEADPELLSYATVNPSPIQFLNH